MFVCIVCNIIVVLARKIVTNCAMYASEDLGGACQVHTPYGTQFFHFRIHFQRKVPVSGVHAPQRVHAPIWEILDPPLVWYHVCFGRYLQKTQPWNVSTDRNKPNVMFADNLIRLLFFLILCYNYVSLHVTRPTLRFWKIKYKNSDIS